MSDNEPAPPIGFYAAMIPATPNCRCVAVRNDTAALSVECPECSAYVGERCRDAWGEFAITPPHAARYAAELRASDEAQAVAAQAAQADTGDNMARVYALFSRMWGRAQEGQTYRHPDWLVLHRVLTSGVVDSEAEALLDRAERDLP